MWELLNNLTTLQQTNIAMDNGPFIDDLPRNNCDFHSNNDVGLPEGRYGYLGAWIFMNFHEFTWIYIYSHSQETTASTQALDVVRQLLGHLGGWGPNTFFSHFLPLPGRMMTLEFLLGSQVQDLHDLRWGSVFDVFQIWFWCDFVLIFKMVQREREGVGK